jgi:hypothetical protein
MVFPEGAEAQSQVAPPAAPAPGVFEHIAGEGSPFDAVERRLRAVPLDADVLVAGGGLAGVCAAIAAARHGARVVLAQDRSRLGGNSSSEVKMHVVGANQHRARPGWREGGLIEELRLADAVNNPQRCWELWDLLLYDKVVSEPNITLLLDTAVCAATVKEGRILEAAARSDRSERMYRIRATIFCDCTGDSRLGLEAGAEMRTGREGRAEFGEPLAPPQPDDLTLGASILFTSSLHRETMPFTPPAWARKITREQVLHRAIDSWEYGYWWIEWGGNHDVIGESERIRFELLSIVTGVWDYIKNSGDFPDSARWAMDWVGMLPGKRGSRRLLGDHILTQDDLMKGGFADAVAIGGWPMDAHPPEGFDRPDLPPNTTLSPPEVYDIPLRALYSRNISNLLMAGRNISASYVAFTSARVMATCAAEGQAIGTASAQCLAAGLVPRQLAADARQVARLQQTLLRDDQTIKGRANEDPLDLARSASVAASGEEGDAKAACLLDGFVRDIPAGNGKPAEIHHWAAPLEEGRPSWIELRWDRPRTIGEADITFDTGFERQLTLSAQASQNINLLRAPQPETVKDYRLLCRTAAGEERVLAEVKNNFQRLNRRRFEPREVRSLRLEIQATNGDRLARVFQIRCYA